MKLTAYTRDRGCCISGIQACNSSVGGYEHGLAAEVQPRYSRGTAEGWILTSLLIGRGKPDSRAMQQVALAQWDGIYQELDSSVRKSHTGRSKSRPRGSLERY